MNKGSKKTLIVIIIVMVILVVIGTAMLFKLTRGNMEVCLDKKNATEITYEEYQKFSTEEKAMLPDYFDSMKDYTIWYNKTIKNEEINEKEFRIDLGNKKPEDFTRKDYQELADEEKVIFPDYFESMAAYNKWYEKTIKTEIKEQDIINIDLGKKNPESFTKKDYQKLTVEEKAMFPDYFETMNDYEDWYNKVITNSNEKEGTIKVDLGNKKPEAFSWQDYKALTIEEKAVFPDCFDSMEEYKEWYKRVRVEK